MQYYNSCEQLADLCDKNQCKNEICHQCSDKELTLESGCKCKKGQFLEISSQKCKNCDKNCATCMNQAEFCTGCQKNLEGWALDLTQNKCVCEQNYYQEKEFVCKKCYSYQNECLKYCPQGTVQNDEYLVCESQIDYDLNNNDSLYVLSVTLFLIILQIILMILIFKYLMAKLKKFFIFFYKRVYQLTKAEIDFQNEQLQVEKMKYELTQINSQQYIYNFQADEQDDERQRKMQELDQKIKIKEVEYEQNINNFKNELDERRRFLAIQKLEFQNQEEDQKRKIEIEKKRKEEMIQFMRIQKEQEQIDKIKQRQKEEHERLEIERQKKLEEKKEMERKIQLENQRKKRKQERQELRDQKRRENQQKVQELRDEREKLYRQKNKCEQQILKAREEIKYIIQLNQDNQSQKMQLQQKIEETQKIKQIIQEKQQEFSGQNQQLQEFMDSIQKQLDRAQKAAFDLSNEDLIFIQNLKHPPERIKLCLEAVIVVLTGTTKQKQLGWDKILKEVGNINFRRNILNYDAGKMNQVIVQKLQNSFINDQNWDLDKMKNAAKATGVLSLWIDSIVKYKIMMVENQPLSEQMKKFQKNQQEIQEQEEIMKEQILQGKSIDQIHQEIQNLDIQQNLVQKQQIQLNKEESQYKEEFDRLNEKIKGLKTDDIEIYEITESDI